MQYATEAVVFARGVRTRAAVLHMLGRARTSVWAIWSREHDDPTQVLEQIRLSMVHPSRAHACFRLLIRLQNEVGALSAATEVLAALKINVVSSMCAISGHHHSTWILLCEDTRFAKQPPLTDRDFRGACLARTYLCALLVEDVLRYVDWQLRQESCSASGFVRQCVENYKGISRVREQPWRCPVPGVENPNWLPTPDPGGFLDLRWDRKRVGDTPRTDGKLFFAQDATQIFADAASRVESLLEVPFHPEIAATANAWRFGLRYHAVEIAPAPHLITFAEEHRCHGGSFELRIDDRDSVLRLANDREARFADGYEKAREAAGVPRGALSSIFSFDAREGAGNVSVLKKRRMLKVKLSYEADANAPGLLAAVLEPLRAGHINLTRMTTSLLSASLDDRERGVAELVGDWRDPFMGLKAQKARLKVGIRSAAKSANATLDSLRIEEHHNLTIFVSTRFDPGWVEGHGFNMIDRIAKVIAQMGFTPVFCLPQNDPTPSVKHLKDHLYARVSEADSLLQIVPLLDTESTFLDALPRLGWMIKEFHSALMRGKPVVQLFQVVEPRAYEANWTAAFDPVTSKDRTCFRFSNVGELMARTLPNAVKSMSKKLVR